MVQVHAHSLSNSDRRGCATRKGCKMTVMQIDTTPRVWIGCLSCYNSGSLVGEWFDAESADDVSLEMVHYGQSRVFPECEELWVMDHEYLPIEGECSPMEAALWGRLMAELCEWERDAFRAYVRTGLGSVDGDGLPDVSEFRDVYCGEFSSFEDYAESLWDDLGYDSEIPEHLRSYIDMDRWTRDLEFDYVSERGENGSVYVFRSL